MRVDGRNIRVPTSSVRNQHQSLNRSRLLPEPQAGEGAQLAARAEVTPVKQVVRIITISALAMVFEASCLGSVQNPQRENENKQQDHEKKQQDQKGQQGAQQEHQQGAPQQQRQQEQNRQQDAQQQREQEQNRRQDARQQEQNRQQLNARQQEQNRHQDVRQIQRSQQQQREQQVEQQRVWQQQRATNWDSEHRSWRQRGGYNGYRIPDSDFRSNYGQNHWFRVYNLPFMFEGGYPRFQYNGYWFSFVDPYPQYWGSDWYQTDDVYVDYLDDGYYLLNRRYPGRPGIAISIEF